MNSSNSFLQHLAAKCYNTFGNESDKLTIVFPNKRAGLFFRKYLSELTDKPIWSPTILSIEDFVLSFSDKQVANQNRLLFALYTVYKRKIKKAESFDNFYHWGEMILNDFNDIDNYQVDSEHIFRIIKSQKELEDAFYYLPEEDKKTIQTFWAGFLPKPTKTQSDFLRTWEILHVLYQEFNLLLSEKNISYKGRIYREVVDALANDELAVEESPVWFAGFNAFTKTEEQIIKYFIKENNAEIYWDVDAYYLEDEMQEAGFFFREYLKDAVFSESIKRDLQQNVVKKDKSISIHSVALSMGQVKAVGEQLEKLSAHQDFSPEKIVIILPDENMLLPMLNSIPEAIEKVNVTMGYPIKNSNYFTFFEMLLELISNTNPKAENQYYKSKSILSLLNHPIYTKVFDDKFYHFSKGVISQNRNYIHINELEKELPKLYGLLIGDTDVDSIFENFKDLLKSLIEDELTTLDKAVVFELRQVFVVIQNSVAEFDLKIDLKSLPRLFARIGTSKVPFSGEPLSGLQIMGILETRNLDFEHVFILDMNETIWPKKASNNSFIPYNIRKAFDLPVIEHQDAIQSYLFYRLLHRVDKLQIYYNNISEFNHSGELSRYVQQIQMELGIKINQFSLANSIEPKAIKPIEIYKNDKIQKALSVYYSNENNNTRLSPSALNTFLDCSLKFYFKYIQKVKEIDELKESLDPAAFGNLLHYTMEYFYQEIIDENASHSIAKQDLQSPSSKLDRAIKKAFADEHKSLDEDDIHSGQQLIAFRVLKKFATQIIKYDEAYAPFEIFALEAGEEDGYMLDIPIEIQGEIRKIGLKGVIDRIDKKGNEVRILDYKSGRDERKFPTVSSIFNRKNNSRNKAAMQVLLYCLFYKQNSTLSNETIVPGVFNIKDLFSHDFDVKIKQGRSNVIHDFAAIESEYTVALTIALEDLFDPDISFDQTDDTKKCDYCPYVGICMR